MTSSPVFNMYFIAIVCPSAINEKVLKYKIWMQQQFGCKVALKSPAHITLVAPFYFGSATEKKLITALDNFQYNNPSLEIQLNNFAHFGNRVIFIGVQENKELNAIYIHINSYFNHISPQIFKADNRPFHPHVTIANRDVKPSAFEKAWEYFSKRKFEASFTSNTISLLKLMDGKWNVIAQKEWITGNMI